MRRAAFAAFLAALTLVASAAAIAGESLYVRASGTEVRGSAGPGGATVGKLDIGTKVDVVSKQGTWVQIKTDKLSGWVFAPKLSKDKPDKERFNTKTNTLAANEGDTAQAIRGLTPTAENFAQRKSISAADIEAVHSMENLKIPNDELASFTREGKLGEFQK